MTCCREQQRAQGLSSISRLMLVHCGRRFLTYNSPRRLSLLTCRTTIGASLTAKVPLRIPTSLAARRLSSVASHLSDTMGGGPAEEHMLIVRWDKEPTAIVDRFRKRFPKTKVTYYQLDSNKPKHMRDGIPKGVCEIIHLFEQCNARQVISVADRLTNAFSRIVEGNNDTRNARRTTSHP